MNQDAQRPDLSGLEPTIKGLAQGDTLFGRYKLEHILGRGGMGVVWKASDQQLSREVALKFLPDILIHDKSALDDLKRETLRSLELTHHNIVRIYDFVSDGSAAGISMEYVDGDTLAGRRIDKPDRFFEVSELDGWIRQFCDALHYAHSTAKVVHRDLKPANIMLTSKGTLKIADFGIARSVSDSVSRVSMAHASSGTLVYMSPQQMDGEIPKPSDDLYALGATLYDLLTGKPPFFTGNIDRQVREKTPTSMTERRTELDHSGEPIPEAWEKAVAACLSKKAEDRPQSIAEFSQMLGYTGFDTSISQATTQTAPEFAKTERATAKPNLPSLPETNTPTPRKKRSLLMLLSIASLIALLVIIGAAGAGTLALFAMMPSGEYAIQDEMPADEHRQQWMKAYARHAQKQHPDLPIPPAFADQNKPSLPPAGWWKKLWHAPPHAAAQETLQTQMGNLATLSSLRLKGLLTQPDGSVIAQYAATATPNETIYLVPISLLSETDKEDAQNNPKWASQIQYVHDLPKGYVYRDENRRVLFEKGKPHTFDWRILKATPKNGTWIIQKTEPFAGTAPPDIMNNWNVKWPALKTEQQLAQLQAEQTEGIKAFDQKIADYRSKKRTRRTPEERRNAFGTFLDVINTGANIYRSVK